MTKKHQYKQINRTKRLNYWTSIHTIVIDKKDDYKMNVILGEKLIYKFSNEKPDIKKIPFSTCKLILNDVEFFSCAKKCAKVL